MMLGPVFAVELLTSARRGRYVLLRVLYAATLLVTLWITWDSFGAPNSPQQMAELATGFFHNVALVQLVAVVALTPVLVAGTIAEEKDRRTLEYLLVSDLRNHEIVLGKLAARLLLLVLLLAVAIPVVALTMLLGGVSLQAVLALEAVTAMSLLSAACLSVLVSVYARRVRDAVITVFLLGLALLLVPWLISIILAAAGWSVVVTRADRVFDALRAANPFAWYAAELIGARSPSWWGVAELARNQAVVALPCVLVAVLRVRAVYVRQTYGKGRPPRRAARRWWHPRLGDSPMIWKEVVVERAAGRVAMLVLMLMVLGPALWFAREMGRGRMSRDALTQYVLLVGTGTACLGLLGSVLRGAASVTGERERGTWDLLLSTPLEPLEVILGKLAGALYAVRGVGLILVVLWLGGVATRAVSVVSVFIACVQLAVLSVFSGLLGITFSLTLRSSAWAMAAALGTSLFLGGGYLFCCVPFLRGGADVQIALAPCVPFLLSIPFLWADRSFLGPGSELFTAVLAGMAFYFVGALALFAIAVASFDDWTGRVQRRPDRASARPGAGPRVESRSSP